MENEMKLLETARDFLDSTDSGEEALEKLLKAVKKDDQLREDCIFIGAQTAITRASHMQRVEAFTLTEHEKKTIAAVKKGMKGPSPIKVASTVGLNLLSNMYLYGNHTRIKDARAQDLLKSIKQYEEHGTRTRDTMFRLAEWQRRIWKEIRGTNKRVGQVLNEEKLRQLRDAVDKEMAA